jgi:hypothetical protein
MVELIFAIVVMGIAMLSLPLMVNTATQSSRVAFGQESIAILAAHTNAIMSFSWDENNTFEATGAGRDGMLQVSNGNIGIDANRTNTSGQFRKFPTVVNIAFSSSTFGKDVDVQPNTLAPELKEDDVDDFHAQTTTLALSLSGTQVANKGDYMDTTINIDTNVTYGSDDPYSTYASCATGTGCAFSQPFIRNKAGTTNIKRIVTRLTSSNVSDKNIVLKSFVCNIGYATPNSIGGF